jgi:hypothetical protein
LSAKKVTRSEKKVPLYAKKVTRSKEKVTRSEKKVPLYAKKVTRSKEKVTRSKEKPIGSTKKHQKNNTI